MAKTKTAFFCTNCGVESPKWVGKCPSCQEWNTYVEEIISSDEKKADGEGIWAAEARMAQDSKQGEQASPIGEMNWDDWDRQSSGDVELNRVLGGGIVAGSVVLVGGEPGIGKSTLMLQVGLRMSARVLYVSGEESKRQIGMRAQRIGGENPELYLFADSSLKKIFKQVRDLQPDILIIDSIQTLQSHLIDSGPGSVSQIKACAGELQRYAKESAVPVFLIGHITKEGSIAGPKILEHIVDTVLQFEGDRNHTYRILRSIKNRFGSNAELGIYEMLEAGLRGVSNPSELLIGNRDEDLPGVAIAAAIEGMRPMLIEVQALVSPSVYGTPQRTATGFDLRRLNMLLAVLEKRLGFPFGSRDVFLNIAGGIKVEDPAIDLAVVSALLSSFDDVAIPSDYCFCGEVGLSGEIRAVGRITQRMAEVEKLGYQHLVMSSYHKGIDAQAHDIEQISVSRVDMMYQDLLNRLQVFPKQVQASDDEILSN
jgi:DNA repair protein RadA/Sms